MLRTALLFLLAAMAASADVEKPRDLAALDPTTLCSSMMEVNVLTGPVYLDNVQILYPVATGYPNNLLRCIIFKPLPDMWVETEFTFVSTELNFDFAEVYDVESWDTNARTVSGVGGRLLQLSGMALPEDPEARRVVGEVGQSIMLVLRTDGNRKDWTGFKAVVVSKWRDCYHGLQVVRTGRTVLTLTDGYKDEYPPDWSMCWVLVPPRGEYVALTFTALNTEKDKDVIEIAGVRSVNAAAKTYSGKKSPIYGAVSGLIAPGPILGATDEMILLNFRTDHSIQLPGFSARVQSPGPYPTAAPTFAPTKMDCEAGMQTFVAPLDSQGMAMSDGFDRYPSDYLYCYIVQPANNLSRALIQFTKLDLDTAGSDQIEIFAVLAYDEELGVITRRGPNIAVLNAFSQLPIAFTGAPRQTLAVMLRTDMSGTGEGFETVIRSALVNTRTPTRQPTMRECASGMTVYRAPPMGEEIVISDGFDGDEYPDNYQFCFVLVPAKGMRLSMTFENVDVANDRVDIFPVRQYNAASRTYRGKGAVMKRITGELLEASEEVVTKNDSPVIVSFRTDWGRSSRGFTGKVRSVFPSPTAAPTPLRRCGTKMVVLKVGYSSMRLDDGFKAVPRAAQLCWVIIPAADNAFVSVRFDSISLGGNGLLEVNTIEGFDAGTKSFNGLQTLTDIRSAPSRWVNGTAGQLVMISYATDTTGPRGMGFVSRLVSVCACASFQSKADCQASTCGTCRWTGSTCV